MNDQEHSTSSTRPRLSGRRLFRLYLAVAVTGGAAYLAMRTFPGVGVVLGALVIIAGLRIRRSPEAHDRTLGTIIIVAGAALVVVGVGTVLGAATGGKEVSSEFSIAP